MSGSAPVPGPSPRPHPALQQRRRSVVRARGRRRRSWALIAVGVAAALMALYWLATGPLLAVHEVDVRGYDRDDSAELVRALEGAAAGGTIVLPATGQMRRVAEAYPWVESVSISRTWPRALTVDVVQARPAAVVTANGQAAMVSASGRVLGPVTPSARLGTIGLGTAVPDPGQTLDENAREVVRLLAGLPAKLAARVRDVRIDRSGVVSAALSGGPALRLGRAERMEAKARALRLMLADVPATELAGASYIDLSVPENPALGDAATPTQ